MANQSDRTKLYIRMLTRRNGATAQELAAAAVKKGYATAGHITRHNSFSLGLFADRNGYDCYFEQQTDDEGRVILASRMRYVFVAKGTSRADAIAAWSAKSPVVAPVVTSEES